VLVQSVNSSTEDGTEGLGSIIFKSVVSKPEAQILINVVVSEEIVSLDVETLETNLSD